MDSHSKKQSGSGSDRGYGGYGGYGGSSGYGYGGYGYGGYGYGGYGYGSKREGGLQRSLQDYLLILRERIWYVIVVFLVVFSTALVYTLGQTKIYQSRVTMSIKRQAPNVNPDIKRVDTETPLGPEELNTIVKTIESGMMVEKVAQRLSGEEKNGFLAPYRKGDGNDPTVQDILGSNRSAAMQRLSLFLEIKYQHPDAQIAAKVANYYAEEYVKYLESQNIEQTNHAIEALRVGADQQQEVVKKKADAVQKYTEQNADGVGGSNPFSSKRDTVTQKLTTLAGKQVEAKLSLSQLKVGYDQVMYAQNANLDLKEIPFIATQVTTQVKEIANIQTQLDQMRKQYGPKMPGVIKQAEYLDSSKKQLDIAVATAVALIKSNYENAQRTLVEIESALKDAQAESKKVEELQVEYDRLATELALAREANNQINFRITQLKLNPVSDPDLSRATVVDQAAPSSESDYISPNYTVNLGAGGVLGLGLGLAFAFFVAYIDDRVKSSFDIESVVGLPLIGIIPQIKKMEQPDKAQIVANNADRQVSEAFLALHSSLRLKDESKNGQCMLITSTIPGEGKSFVTTNLALTFAAHGERVIVVDCDLRKPNIHKSFHLENLKGLIDVIAGTATIDDVAVKQLHPNLDIIPSGGRAKTPTQILNSKKFEILVSELRKRYDRIFFDTPPLAAVSDALIILPLCDGSLFSIFFNKVRRKAAQFAAKKLLEANVPVYGAILNGLNLTVSGYYYAQYYDKSYKDYYVVMSKTEKTDKGNAAPER